ncbi:MAG: hypothetical protein A3F54_01610 [Candidatus Kerfeldbacteria bacterium RIFCSPHIGHO2_12_FULL_48_17]|uniref:HTH cro/C1-type domain-containing protein n=1 Tax=Candidatus Kerfeldbacteria bacterium RIFCSPHIGHO2_12_FULL_48_17 TaxID=1798542 RepID=A0A1G2AZP0_9BACT|nr:MAG: hypothetical protein A3F54_01610 [Candidatus Kerfeldbacteria bacterium RIFCSPHIGHO2_12_FULL_48_17]
MVAFREKSIDEKTLGEQLRRARQTERVSLLDASRKLRIKREYLQALERSDYKALPSEVFIRSFLKSYARFLHLNWKRVLKTYESEGGRLYHKRFAEQRHKTLLGKRRLKSVFVPRIFRFMAAGVFVLAIFSYIGWQVYQTFVPPDLHIVEPFDNVITQEHFVRVAGYTTPESQVTINGQGVTVDSGGQFQESVNLHEGLNTIEIVTKKGHSRQNVAQRYVVVDSNSQALLK